MTDFFGFNLKVKHEIRTAEEIVSGKCYTLVNYVEVVIGWKVAKELPSWVDDAITWEGFLIDIEDDGVRSARFPEDSYYDDESSNSEKSVMKQYSVVNVKDKSKKQEDSEYYDKEKI